MNPSYECMRRAREESKEQLLEMQRWDVAKRLKALEFGEGSHENLSAIASVIYEPSFGWTLGACDYLRNQLVELIGGECASDAQRGCACGTDTCNHSHEQTPFVGYDVLDNERHKAVRELRKLDLHPNSVMNNQEVIADALGVDFKVGELFSDAMRRRLIHLLGGDEIVENAENYNLGNEPDGQNDNATITSELRKWVRIREMETIISTTMPPQMEERPTYSGQRLLAIADRIDEQYEVTQKQIADLERECESLQAMVERRNVKCRTYRCHIDQMKGGSKRWREKCANLEEENRGLKAALSCLEVDFKRIRGLASQIIDHTHDKETAADE